MHPQRKHTVSGHLRVRDGKRGKVFYAKYRLPDGRQVERKIGPKWNGTGRPADGYYTDKTAQAALDEILVEARRGTLAGMHKTGAAVADAAAEWLRHAEQE